MSTTENEQMHRFFTSACLCHNISKHHTVSRCSRDIATCDPKDGGYSRIFRLKVARRQECTYEKWKFIGLFCSKAVFFVLFKYTGFIYVEQLAINVLKTKEGSGRGAQLVCCIE